MPEVSHIDIEVRPSRNYQTVGFSARLVWETPVSMDEAKFEADVAYSELEEIALKRVNQLAEQRTEAMGIPIQAAHNYSNQSVGVNPVDDSTWPIAHKPNGAGSFRYLPTSVVSRDQFLEMAKAKLPDLGLSEDVVNIFDDRTGDRGVENGGQSYTAGKIKAKPDTALAAAMQGKTIVANIDFAPGGDLKLSLSRDGKTAMQAMKIAGQFAATETTPF
jgi:hypothetical protein